MSNHKPGITLNKYGTSPVIAVPRDLYLELKNMKDPGESFHSTIRRLMTFYKANR